jgi:hypothetical protein
MRIEPESTPTSKRSRMSSSPAREEPIERSSSVQGDGTQSIDISTQKTPQRSAHKKNLFTKKTIILGIVILGLLAFAAYSRYEIYQLGKMKDPAYQQQLAEQQTRSITDQVAKIMLLPEGTPQVATVSDVDSLKKTQPFFNNAQNGDNVLIYKDEAILYRASTQKIINVAPITRDQSQSQLPPAQTAEVGSTTTSSTTKEPVKSIKK